jgi:hypothetical protein
MQSFCLYICPDGGVGCEIAKFYESSTRYPGLGIGTCYMMAPVSQ